MIVAIVFVTHRIDRVTTNVSYGSEADIEAGESRCPLRARSGLSWREPSNVRFGQKRKHTVEAALPFLPRIVLRHARQRQLLMRGPRRPPPGLLGPVEGTVEVG